jgi:hypothetical protein
MLSDEKDRRIENSKRENQGGRPNTAAPWREVLRVVWTGHLAISRNTQVSFHILAVPATQGHL